MLSRGRFVLLCAAALAGGCQCGPALHGAEYGTLWVSSEASGRLTVLDAADGGVVGQVELPGDGGRGASVAVSPDGETVYAANEGAGTVSIVDVRGLAVTGTVTGLDRPRDLRTSPDGKTLYVAQAGSVELAAIDLATLAVQTYPAGVPNKTSRTQSVWVTPAGDVYVLNQLSSTVVALDLALRVSRWNVPVATNPTRLVATKAGDVGYVTGAFDGVVQRVELAGVNAPDAGAVTPVGASPTWLTLAPDERRLVVSNGGVDTTVSVVDLGSTFREAGKVTVGAGDVGQNVLSPGGETAFVCVGLPPHVSVVDVARREVVSNYPLSEAPRGLAFLPRLPR